jgi:hypothetical protein
MKQKKWNRTWFEQKVSELGQAIKRLPRERQLELFDALYKPEVSPREQERTGRKETHGE